MVSCSAQSSSPSVLQEWKKGQASADQALRFDLVLEGEWGKLLNLLEKDERHAKEASQKRQP